MRQLIKGRKVVDDLWTLLREAATLADVPDGIPVIVPLTLWQARRAALFARGDVGVWLAPADDPRAIAGDVGALPLVAVDFPQFTDGRGYSIARLLRDRYAFKGELRAIGDVLRDQLFALSECGFDAFAIREDRNQRDALSGFDDYAGVYAATSRTPQPWFRRRGGASGATSASRDLEVKVSAVVGRLRDIATRHAPAVLASGFGAEGMVLIDLIAQHALPIRIFTLDTGRLPEETLALIDRTRERYGLPVDVYAPDAQALEAFVRQNGVNPFYRGVELRKSCCAVRKTEPLKRALAGRGAWITGLRRAQSTSRTMVATEEFDAVHGLPKFNPLAEWSLDEIWQYLRAHRVPHNALHDRGFPSIGCAPCTRAVVPGEDERAGRWWWEVSEHKECGLHRSVPALQPRW
ncbi:MAG: phosphoadenylyl-sulfate reductase [Betaproteobacteria bacterium]